MARASVRHDVELTSFVGRHRELLEGRRLLGEARLLTLVGPGGIGKTRLARRLADDAARAFPDGTFLLELATVRDAGALMTSLASVLGLEGLTHSPEYSVLEFLHRRRVLLVLDSCEHLLDGCAGMSTVLLTESPDLRVISTSRQPLGVPGEQLMGVGPLSLPTTDDVRRPSISDSEAMELFAERARLVVPSFELQADNAELVGRLCTVLDGMPLAIELAAARLRVLSLLQLADRLRDRFGVLAVATTASMPRHQTLRESVDWSFDLCSPREQALWARMSVFEGGADLESVEVVCADGGLEVFEAVAGLVDKSVLVPHEVAGRVRYRMLETIRDYGRERLAERGEAAELAERHRCYFVELVMAITRSRFGPDQRERFARLRADLANISAAFETSLATSATRDDAILLSSMSWYWISVGAMEEGLRWAERSLAGHLDPTPETMHAIYDTAWMAFFKGDRDRAEQIARRALELADNLDDSSHGFSAHVVAEERRVRGLLAFLRGDTDAAIPLIRQTLPLGPEAEPLAAEFNVSTFVKASLLLSWAGWTDEALRDIDEGITLCSQWGDEWYLSLLLCLRGARFADLGRYQEALDSALESLRMARGLTAFTVVSAIELIAQVSPALGDGSRAAVLLGALSGMWPGIGMSRFAEDQDRHAEGERRARELLGDSAYESAFERGRGLSIDQAAAFALGDPTAPTDRRGEQDPVSTALTRRELEVAELIARGLSNKGIAQKLVISPRTAEGHVNRLLQKLQFESRAGVAAWVAERQASGH